MNKDELARQAMHKALQLRSKQNIEYTDSVSIYDVTERIGINEVRFVDIPSLEEMYWKDQKKIIISSHRPSGRQAFNCAHGLGHHMFGHGFCITGVDDGMEPTLGFQPSEFLANTFAGFFLMPKTTVCYGFHCRGWSAKECTPLQVYTVACWLGVGYGTLVNHMWHSLRILSPAYARRLLKITPSKIKQHVLRNEFSRNMMLVDDHWSGRAVDIEVGDVVVLSQSIHCEGEGLENVGECRYGNVFVASSPGCSTRAFNHSYDWKIAVRISRKDYCGRNLFRFDEDPDYEPQKFDFV